jgi:hypothetical protein
MIRFLILVLSLVSLTSIPGLAAGNQPAAPSGPLVISERWPQATDLVSWTHDVMRLEHLENASETAQAKAFFEWLRLFSRMAVGGMIQAYEGDYGHEAYVTDQQKNLFVYGWGYCDTFSRIAEAAWKEYKKDPLSAERVCVQHDDGGFHTMYRLRLDGHHAAFDARYGYYLIERDAPDARILDWAEVGVDANVLSNRGFHNRSRPFFEIFGVEWDRALLLKPIYFESEDSWQKAGAPKESVFGNSQYKMGTHLHDMSFRLPRGTVIERFWDNTKRAFYVPVVSRTLTEWPFLPAGRFYRVTDVSLDGNWAKFDPNYQKAKPYLVKVPAGEGYQPDMVGHLTIGQAWGRIRYTPNLRDGVNDALAPGSTLVHADQAPYLRPRQTGEGGEATFDFYSPYVLVDGTLHAELAGAAPDEVKLEVRTLRAKPASESAPDVWSPWQTLHSGPGRATVELGRPRFNGKDVSIHGVYRFQVRVSVNPHANRTAPAGLSGLGVELYFESGIMSIPQIFAGANRIQFKLHDAAQLRGPVRVTYAYQTIEGDKSHTQVLHATDFHSDVARYSFDAPGLVRCKSLSIAY